MRDIMVFHRFLCNKFIRNLNSVVPHVFTSWRRKLMIYLGFSRFLSVLDLNFDSFTYGLLPVHAKDPYEPKQACL